MQTYCINCKKNIYSKKNSFPIFCNCGQVINEKIVEPPFDGYIECNICPTIEDQFKTLAAPWVTETRLIEDSKILLGKISHLDIERVIGVPRSGMIPASVLATSLGVPLGSISKDGIIDLKVGIRMRSLPKPKGLTVIVEDSSASGWSISEIKKYIDTKNCIFIAVYSTHSASSKLDYYSKILPLPHWFSWNIFGNDKLLNGFNIGCDFDGVICKDCPIIDDDDGERYLKWMRTSIPKFRTLEREIPFIITARLEKYRKETEEWLLKNKIKCKTLIMGPWKSQIERNGYCIGSWKLENIIKNNIHLFIESDDYQARVISKGISKPIICTNSETCYVDGIGPQWKNEEYEYIWNNL